MRREPDFFGDHELELLYIAKRLKEALRVEDILTQGGLDYAVETDKYRGGVLFASERVGAFFYVLPSALEKARATLLAAGIRLR